MSPEISVPSEGPGIWLDTDLALGAPAGCIHALLEILACPATVVCEAAAYLARHSWRWLRRAHIVHLSRSFPGWDLPAALDAVGTRSLLSL